MWIREEGLVLVEDLEQPVPGLALRDVIRCELGSERDDGPGGIGDQELGLVRVLGCDGLVTAGDLADALGDEVLEGRGRALAPVGGDLR